MFNKKILAIVVLFASILSPLFSQSVLPPNNGEATARIPTESDEKEKKSKLLDISIGINASIGINWAYSNVGEYEFSGGTGNTGRMVQQIAMAGGDVMASIELSFKTWYSFVPEIGYSFCNGVKYNGNVWRSDLEGVPGNYDPLTGQMYYTYGSININLLNKFIFFNTGKVSFHGLIGPSFRIAVTSMKEDYNASLMEDNPDGSNNAPYGQSQTTYSDVANPFQFGMTFGMGFTVEAGPGFFVIDIRSSWYFTPTIETLYSDGAIYESRPVSLGVGYMFTLGDFKNDKEEKQAKKNKDAVVVASL